MQIKLISVQFIVFFLLVSATSAALSVPDIPGGEGGCCVPFYDGTILFNELGSLEANIAFCDDWGSVYEENCYADSDGDGVGEFIDPTIVNNGCCCERLNDNSLQTVSSGSRTIDGYLSKLFCDLQGYIYVGPEPDCDFACGNPSDFYVTEGVIETYEGVGLEGLTLRSNGKVAKSGKDGSFKFSDEFAKGNHDFEIIVPVDYHLYCQPDLIVSKYVEGIKFNIEISCAERSNPTSSCESNWQVLKDGKWRDLDSVENGGWSDCFPRGFNEYFKKRDLNDSNGCAIATNIPPISTSEGCEAEELNIGCDGNYVDGETCDGNTFLYHGEKFNPLLPCSVVFGDTFIGDVSCNDRCALDVSECKPDCSCSTTDECNNRCRFICELSDTCINCKKALRFIPKDAPTSGDIFDLYNYLIENPKEGFLVSPITYSLGTRDVTVDWNYIKRDACASELWGFEIMVCEGSGGSCYPEKPVYVQSFNGIETDPYTFENILKPETSFCYNIVAKMQSGDEPLYDEGKYPCYETGHISCMENQLEGRNCVYLDSLNDGEGGFGPTSCEQLNEVDSRVNLKTTTKDCPDGTVCIETEYDETDEDSGAACVQKELCQSCNGMFGLFASYNLPILDKYGHGGATRCKSLLFSAEEGADIPSSTITANGRLGQCYKDESVTLFSFYDECQEIVTCYDYKSEGTCGFDPCFKFTNATIVNGKIDKINLGTGCEWNYNQEEFGVGVCRPKEEEKQNCGLCDSSSPLGFCSDNMCDLYGDNTCYYKEKGSEIQREAIVPQSDRELLLPSCLKSTEFSCVLYDTIEDCLGATPEIVPLVDVLYDEYVGDVEFDRLLVENRIAGNNIQWNKSDDKLGFGDCNWHEDTRVPSHSFCFKNSNNFIDDLHRDDCNRPGVVPVDCFKDTKPPVTTLFSKEGDIPIYGESEILDIKFGVEDDYSTPDEIITYISVLNSSCIVANMTPCIVAGQEKCLSSKSPIGEINAARDAGCYIYPRYTMDELFRLAKDGTLISKTGGEHLIVFFSEDNARNLEVLQTKTITVDSTAPLVEIEDPILIVQQLYEDVFVTDLSIAINVHEKSFCNSYLTDEGAKFKVSPGDVAFEADLTENNPDTFTASYVQLIDGRYKFVVECYDEFENLANESITFDIGSDISISPVKPIGAVFNDTNKIKLEINTSFNGVCKFDTISNTFENSRFNFSDPIKVGDRFVFTADFPKELGSLSGVYTLFLSCDFDEKGITESKSGDVLSFSIDTIPPDAFITENGQPIITTDFEEWKQERRIEFNCNDAILPTPEGWNLGCQYIRYCITTSYALVDFNGSDPRAICAASGDNFIYREVAESSVSEDLDHFNDYTYSHFFVEDNGGTRSKVIKINNKIRDTEISSPKIVIV